MRKRIKLLLGGAIALLTTAAIAQTTIAILNLSGNEVLSVELGIGGSGAFTPIYTVRNGTAMKTFSGAGSQTYTMTNKDSTLYWVGTAPTTWTITTPPTAFDGEILTVGTDTLLTSLVTITASTGQSLNTAFSSGTIPAASSIAYQYSNSTTKWYRLR